LAEFVLLARNLVIPSLNLYFSSCYISHFCLTFKPKNHTDLDSDSD
jgi:hypothetical protein